MKARKIPNIPYRTPRAPHLAAADKSCEGLHQAFGVPADRGCRRCPSSSSSSFSPAAGDGGVGGRYVGAREAIVGSLRGGGVQQVDRHIYIYMCRVN